MGWLTKLKTEGYRISCVGCADSEIMLNYPIFTIYLYLWHATILILSAVEGLNGFKKLNIKDIGYLVFS